MPTRFKYTKVDPQSFALSPVEILLATDAELNQYMGLKKLAPYRKDGNKWDKTRTSRLQELKQKIKERGVKLGAGEDLSRVLPDKPAKKRKGKKERMKEKAAAQVVAVDVSEENAEQEEVAESAPSSGKKRKANEDQSSSVDVAPDREASKKKRRRHKKSTQEA